MDCAGQISGLVETMENLHNSRAKLLDRYIQAVRVDIDLNTVRESCLSNSIIAHFF